MFLSTFLRGFHTLTVHFHIQKIVTKVKNVQINIKLGLNFKGKTNSEACDY